MPVLDHRIVEELRVALPPLLATEPGISASIEFPPACSEIRAELAALTLPEQDLLYDKTRDDMIAHSYTLTEPQSDPRGGGFQSGDSKGTCMVISKAITSSNREKVRLAESESLEYSSPVGESTAHSVRLRQLFVKGL